MPDWLVFHAVLLQAPVGLVLRLVSLLVATIGLHYDSIIWATPRAASYYCPWSVGHVVHYASFYIKLSIPYTTLEIKPLNSLLGHVLLNTFARTEYALHNTRDLRITAPIIPYGSRDEADTESLRSYLWVHFYRYNGLSFNSGNKISNF